MPVVIIYFMLIWLLCDLTAWIIRKCRKKERTRNYAGGAALLLYACEREGRHPAALVFGVLLAVFGFMLRSMEFLPCFALMAVLTLVRMTALSDSAVYRKNALMNANPFYLGMVLLIFGLFNVIFVGGYFKTAYKLTPFFTYIVAAFVAIGIAEALHHIPGLGAVNAFGFDDIVLQTILLICGIIVYLALTLVSYRKACADFEVIDL